MRAACRIIRPAVAGRRWINFSSTDKDPVPLCSASDGPRLAVNIVQREVLQLWRDVIRSTRLFTWLDKDGTLWKEKILNSARAEFKLAKHERDPEEIVRLIVNGQEALEKVTEQMAEKARRLVVEEAAKKKHTTEQGRQAAVQTAMQAYQHGDEMAWKSHFYDRAKTWEQRQPGGEGPGLWKPSGGQDK